MMTQEDAGGESSISLQKGLLVLVSSQSLECRRPNGIVSTSRRING
jgi:hypothetical protein